MKKTKIVCTIGPASDSEEVLTEMVKAGMNVARLNFSHGDYNHHLKMMETIRKVSKALSEPIAIMQDLQGPKIRVGKLAEPLEVNMGDKVVIGRDFSLDFDISQSVKPRQVILIEDGLIELRVDKVLGKKIYCTALTPGKIQSNKGINLPRTKVKFPILTDKDIQDLKFGLANDVDYVALSFVRGRNDIVNLKRLISKHNPKRFDQPKVIAKIEKPEAVKSFDAILKEADGIMVARGDLGVELPESQVPIIQKTIIRKCLQAAKPVIVATQMLDSMIRNPRPTRAEVSDVANAVIDHTDAVMLSGETAFGKYPLQAVQQMTRIIQATEKSPYMPGHKHLLDRVVSRSEAIAESVFDLAVHTKAKVIVGATASGFTAREVAHERPISTRIVMLTPKEKTLRQMTMLWGITGYPMPEAKSFDELVKLMMETVKKHKIVRKGERLIIVTGEPLGQKENLNLVEIRTA